MNSTELEKQMTKTIEATQRAFNTIRTGRANATLLDKVMVETEWGETPLKSMASITVPDASTLQIKPFDPKSLNTIERSISLSDVNLTPNNDGKVIRLNIPALTNERRKEFVKLAQKYAEEGKVGLRNIRRDAIESVRKQEKSSDLSKDESRDEQDKIQKITNKYVAKIDKLLAEKEKAIMTV